MTEMLALFDNNFKTALIKKKKYFNGQLGTCLKQKKKKKSGQRKKEIKNNQIKKFRPENTKIKIKTQQMPQEKRTDEKINELEDRTIKIV